MKNPEKRFRVLPTEDAKAGEKAGEEIRLPPCEQDQEGAVCPRMITATTIALCDVLNPGFGYSVHIVGPDGVTLLFDDRDPVTGADLLTYASALEVCSWYANGCVGFTPKQIDEWDIVPPEAFA